MLQRKIFTKITRSDLSLRHVAATCRLVCTDHYNHLRSAIWPGDEVEPETLTCSVSISFLAACLSKVKFIFVVVTNACCVYFVYIYGAFIKYLKVLFSCVCCLLID